MVCASPVCTSPATWHDTKRSRSLCIAVFAVDTSTVACPVFVKTISKSTLTPTTDVLDAGIVNITSLDDRMAITLLSLKSATDLH